MTINDGLPRSLSELNSRPSRWCIRVPRENEYSIVDGVNRDKKKIKMRADEEDIRQMFKIIG